jgi:hypothetical protein
MANAVEKVNTIAIADIEAINTITDDNLEDLNTLEFTGTLPMLIDLTFSGLTWSASSASPMDHHVPGTSHIGTATAGGLIDSDWITMLEWNGTGTTGTWTDTGAEKSVKTYYVRAGGTQTTGIVYGGYDADGSVGIDTTELYNGTTWSTNGSLDMVSGTSGGCGGGNVQTNQLHTGGSTYSPTVRDHQSTEYFNGTVWSDAGDDSTGQSGSQCVGTTNFVKVSGSYDAAGIDDECEYFTLSTTTWSTIADITNATRYNKCWGDESRTFTCGGYGTDGLGAPVYYLYHDACEMWVDNVWSNQTALPSDQGGWGVGGSDGGTNVGGGWFAGGNERYAQLDTHYIAVAV